MSRLSVALLVCAIVVMAAMIVGCSDDKKTTEPVTTYPLQLVDFDSIVGSVAPPEFTPPATAPGDIDSAWLYGNYPLMGKIFGSDDPQTLYANVKDFTMQLEILTYVARVDADQQIVTGTYTDSVEIDEGSGPQMQHFTATVTALSEPVAIPANAQDVLGETIEVDYLITVDVEEMTDRDIKIGMTVNDSVQTILMWEAATGGGNVEESRLKYGSLRLEDSTFVFKGVGHVLHEGGEVFNYGFDMSSSANSDFSYRMSWYSNGLQAGNTMLGSITGGGNRSTEFALKYRQFMPADSAECDSAYTMEQVFGENYSAGSSLVSAFSDYLGDDKVFLNSMLPSDMIDDPYATE